MGNPISGRQTIIGAVKGSAWGTPVQVGANHALLPLSSGLGRGYELLEDLSLGGSWELDPQRGVLDASGPLNGYLRYDNNEWLLIALLMGTAGAPAQQGGTTAYLHTLQIADGVAGKFATVAQLMKSDEVWEFPSVKPTSLRLTGGKRVPLVYTIEHVASHMNRNGGTGTNNTTTIAAITARETLRRIVPQETAYLRINDQSAGALSSSDNQDASSFELTFTRPQQGDNVLDGNAFITEPVGTDFTRAEFTATFPVYGDDPDLVLDKWEADTPQKIELGMDSGSIVAGTAIPYSLTIQMPQATVVGRPAVTIPGPGKLAIVITFRLTKAAAAPTGMTGVTNPFAMLLINKRATDILA